jgi:ABC-type branched-subunit amino acid transport system substrate-binding protein
MTSVLNHLLQLSGNKYIIFGLLCLALSCSSKQFANEQDKLKSDYEKQHRKSNEQKSDIKVVKQTPVDTSDLIYPVNKKTTYKIVFILPLMLKTDNQFEPQQRSLAHSALEFYMGAMIALQKETEKSKNHFDVYIYDCDYKTGSITSQIIPELKKIQPDLIIGPFLFDHLKELSPYCRENKINLISPLVNSDSCLNVNPYFLALRPTEKTHLAYLTNLLKSNFQQYNISIIAESAQEKDRYTKMISSLIDPTRFGKIQSYFVNESNWRAPNFVTNMTEGKNVFIIFNKSSEVVINSLLTNLIGIQNKEETALIAPYGWLFQSTIDLGFLQSLNSHFITDYYFNYDDSTNFDFISRYRNKYNNEPNLLGCLGYTYTNYFCSMLQDKGTYFQHDWLKTPAVIDSTVSIQMIRFPGQLGFQNYHMTILHYEGSELKQLNLK